jgi:hypothetical protein
MAFSAQSIQRRTITSQNLMIVDPCIIVQFIKKNPTRCNNVSKFHYSIIV